MSRNEITPCKDCEFRQPGCSGHCVIDAEGGYGYKAWLADVHAEKERRREYLQKWNEDYKRSEAYDWNRRKRGSGR